MGAGLSAVLGLGDLQYENGTLAKFNQSYDPSWGRVKSITYPAPGNHEYQTAGAAGYFDYFGARAGDRTKGYYSFDVGAWHLIALNSECAQVGGCGAGSAQLAWLIQDLQASSAKACTLAFWHTPRFSSGAHGSNAAYQPFWQALYDHRADVVLVGHDHDYERFAPQTPTGAADSVRGIRQFVVGTGGKNLRAFGTIAANSEERQTGTYGILKLTLHATSYDWQFVPEAGKTYTDTGSASCHGFAPTAAFTGSPTSGTAPLSVSFTDQSTGSPTSWAWDFDGNGTIDSTQQNPSFTYQNPGTYTVKLTAANAHGGDDELKTGYVVVSAPPKVEPRECVEVLPGLSRCSAPGEPAPENPQPPVPIDPEPSDPPPVLDVIVREPPLRAVSYSLAAAADGSAGAARARTLVVGGAAGRQSAYLAFAPKASGRGLAVSLRLFVTDPSRSLVTVRRCATGWTESQLHQGRKPRLVGSALARARPLQRGRWLDLELAPTAIPADGKLCLALLSTGKDPAAFGSRESRTPPRLVLQTR